ncbi:MAG: hemerythrin domain-containing protein [Kofleriaceae bacterium]
MIRSPGLTAAPVDDSLVAALAGCHERIRRFTALAARLAEATSAPLAERREAAAAVVRYFTVALPLHAADEDDSVGPRLRGASAAVDAALVLLAREHTEHAAVIAPVVAACQAIVATPACAPAHLAEAAAALAAAFASHLALEEAVIFPAVAALADDVAATIQAEMRARRR